jgi:hypothetical protein
MAKPAIVGTATCAHEGALFTVSNRCTNHWNHLPFDFDLIPNPQKAKALCCKPKKRPLK